MRRALLGAAALAVLGAVTTVAADELNGRWQGTVSLPDRTFEVFVVITGEGEQRSAKIDIPTEGVIGETFDDVRYRHPRVYMELLSPVEAILRGKLKKGKIVGVVVQGSSTGRFELVPVVPPGSGAP